MIPFQPRKLVMALAAVLPSVASVSALAQEATPPAAAPSTPATTAPATNVRDLSETRVTQCAVAGHRQLRLQVRHR